MWRQENPWIKPAPMESRGEAGILRRRRRGNFQCHRTAPPGGAAHAGESGVSSVMPLLKELCEEEKPREKFALSPGAASMADLVAILLRTGTKGCSVLELARRVIHELEDGHSARV